MLREMKLVVRIAVFFTICCGRILCDTPANCTYDDIVGEWVFYEGDREFDSSLSCENFTASHNSVFKIRLRFPNVAIDEYGNKGFWTIVYNQGFEVVINYRKYFAFSMYEQNDTSVTSYCSLTMNGWSHDIFGNNWACYYTERFGVSKEPKFHLKEGPAIQRNGFFPRGFVQLYNRLLKSWTAIEYTNVPSLSVKDLVHLAGGSKSRVLSPPPSKDVQANLKRHLAHLPQSFDWRNVSGINYVSPVREQGPCGSCYALSTLGMLESRLRITTNSSIDVKFSPQDIISCSNYSQGCEGGFSYLAAKYAQDFGVVPEECFPYEARDHVCSAKKCKRYYVAEYNYIGGFFGGCNEELMKLDLVQNGPIVSSIEVHVDFVYYKEGVYHHIDMGPTVQFDFFDVVNHKVLIVGYGVSNENGEKYWIAQNSWGAEWGEQGYFKIRRGTNECGIESMAVYAKPIP